MKLSRLKNKLFKEAGYLTGKLLAPPEFVSLLTTYRCNFHCQMCQIWKTQNQSELGLAEWNKIIVRLKDFFSAETFIEINGGEPLMRKELLYFMITDLKKYFSNVGINSNGSLIDENVVTELEKRSLDFVKISLYSLDDAIHDQLRGFPGAAEGAKRAVELLQKTNIKIELGILITAKNISNISKLIEYYSQPKFKNVTFILQPLDEPIESPESKDWTKDYSQNNLWPSNKEVTELFSWIRKNKIKKIKNSSANITAIEKYYLASSSALERRCFAGQHSFIVYPDGETALCFKGKKLGNILQNSIKKILSANAIPERQRIKKCRKHCRIVGCNFSRTFSEIVGN